ncbi:MAG TPA: hypothetical protein PLP61_16665 [Nocardioides sp.]|uniref:hypothetical protein n=1 Tax=Nocardioides sp. TaxID=35761 RepID=UPI002CECED10|nr:hypothetical protein [Nocardioides sp.]HQR28679.1 hypothetical protein [Nocardioides sp.]
MKKWMILAALTVGYVLGAKAGRQRYETIRSRATKVWNDPKVQGTAAQAQDLVKQKAPEVQEKVAAAAASAAAKVKGSDTSPEPTPVYEG